MTFFLLQKLEILIIAQGADYVSREYLESVEGYGNSSANLATSLEMLIKFLEKLENNMSYRVCTFSKVKAYICSSTRILLIRLRN